MYIYQVTMIRFIFQIIFHVNEPVEPHFASAITFEGTDVHSMPHWCPAQWFLQSQVLEAAMVTLIGAKLLAHSLVCSLISE